MDHEKEYPAAAKIIKTCFYMDDGLWGADSIAELKMLCREVQFVLRQGGFELGKWASNSRAVEKLMLGDEAETIDLCDSNAESKVLGLRWIKDTDELTIFVRKNKETQCLTKRYIIGEITRLYDPSGYCAPVIVVSKIIMQDIWKQKDCGWDDAVPAEIQQRWLEFVKCLPDLGQFRIPRWLSIGKNIQMEIHGFCDACIKAYGAVLYMRSIDADGKINCTLITAKSKVAPLKSMTIPRLELHAALLCSKLTHQVVTSCEFYVKQYLWSDSMIALHWIKRSPSDLKMYVGNRVQEIKENARHATWSHVGTLDNPADILSRGANARDFIKYALWKQGPEWLKKPQSQWPKSKLTVTPEMQTEIGKEVKASQGIYLSIFTLNHTHYNTQGMQNQMKTRELLTVSNSFKKVIRITAYALRFIKNTRMKRNERYENYRKNGTMTTNLKPLELLEAARIWIRQAQLAAYKKELESINAKEATFSQKRKIGGLKPYLDEHGVLRAGGRIDKADVPYDRKHPIIIPPRSRLAYLLISQAHDETKHGGVQAMMAFIRSQYCIP